MNQVWLVFQWYGKELLFQGVFDTEQKAVDACKSERYCVCPAIMNEELVHSREDNWPGAYYPKL